MEGNIMALESIFNNSLKVIHIFALTFCVGVSVGYQYGKM